MFCVAFRCFISVGRYLGIRNPLHARQALLVSRRAVIIKIGFAWFLSALITSPITILALADQSNVYQEEPTSACTISNRYFLFLGQYRREIKVYGRKVRVLQFSRNEEEHGHVLLVRLSKICSSSVLVVDRDLVSFEFFSPFLCAPRHFRAHSFRHSRLSRASSFPFACRAVACRLLQFLAPHYFLLFHVSTTEQRSTQLRSPCAAFVRCEFALLGEITRRTLEMKVFLSIRLLAEASGV